LLRKEEKLARELWEYTERVGEVGMRCEVTIRGIGVVLEQWEWDAVV
jgi:hypothetical protein